MTIGKRTIMCGLAATSVALAVLALPERPTSRLVSSAEAIIGRPLTPMSYAGVARRTTRRTVAVGAAAAGAGYYYAAPPAAVGCVQVVDSYGRITYRCP
jgi:hypothetical protein